MYPDYQLVAWSLSIPNGITRRDTLRGRLFFFKSTN